MGVELKNPRLTDPPELFPGFGFYLQAFWRLHTCRPPGMSGVPWIPWSAINDYAKRYDMSNPDWYRFEFYMSRMDEEFRKYFNDKQELERAQEKDGHQSQHPSAQASAFREKLPRSR